MVDWRVAKSLNVLFTQINDLAPGRSRVSDGSIGDAAHATRTSDHNPWITDPPGPNVVSARDFTHDPARGADMGDIFEALRLSRDRRIKYGIFNWRIFTYYPAHGYPAWTWRPYSGPNGHKTHGHLSVRSEKHLYDNTDPWQIQGDDMAFTSHEETELKRFVDQLDKVGSNGGFVKYLIPWFRRLSHLTPEMLAELEESDEIAAVEAKLDQMSGGTVDNLARSEISKLRNHLRNS